ncbi:hypothetical protein Poly30_44300 [Planctomycetes bacterium Poly30]|uniref:WD domain, G-beta repeat n=2 Tax=Saltatorellus ferox TaxID=2528018 RepID=A0A518EXQ4_9BACT|nr:hypothetical protein Poly30_44300 [Planctomycetes bacterium Poly30]
MVRIADEAPVVAASFADGRLLLLHARTKDVLKSLPAATGAAELWRLDMDRSGDLVALLTRDNRVWHWRWRTEDAPHVVATLSGELGTWEGWRFGAALEFGPAGKRLFVGHARGGALLLDGEEKAIVTFGDRGPASPQPGEADAGIVDEDGKKWRAVRATGFDFPRSWSKDGERLALITEGGCSVFSTDDGRLLASGIGPEDGSAESLALSPEGDHLVAGCYGGALVKYEVATGKEIWRHLNTGSMGMGHDPSIFPLSFGAVQFSPDGTLVSATTTTGIHAVLLRASSGELAWKGKHCGGRMGEPAEIVWQPDSKSFFFAFVSGVMSIHQVRLREESASGFAEEQTRAVGTLPDFGWDGVGVFNGSKAITAVSDADFRLLWATEG